MSIGSQTSKTQSQVLDGLVNVHITGSSNVQHFIPNLVYSTLCSRVARSRQLHCTGKLLHSPTEHTSEEPISGTTFNEWFFNEGNILKIYKFLPYQLQYVTFILIAKSTQSSKQVQEQYYSYQTIPRKLWHISIESYCNFGTYTYQTNITEGCASRQDKSLLW